MEGAAAVWFVVVVVALIFGCVGSAVGRQRKNIPPALLVVITASVVVTAAGISVLLALSLAPLWHQRQVERESRMLQNGELAAYTDVLRSLDKKYGAGRPAWDVRVEKTAWLTDGKLIGASGSFAPFPWDKSPDHGDLTGSFFVTEEIVDGEWHVGEVTLTDNAKELKVSAEIDEMRRKLDRVKKANQAVLEENTKFLEENQKKIREENERMFRELEKR